eukprot:TRINITY_DN32228_c0_g1_i2.p1 TRINITY_DN32228_c0_g1~~TRINITY_DN32228_c0_g1_i2.p1  ORF type:complete len:222 (-),score=28.77 TRINITY_DN32228_c0_g1_i2:49-714(-)
MHWPKRRTEEPPPADAAPPPATGAGFSAPPSAAEAPRFSAPPSAEETTPAAPPPKSSYEAMDFSKYSSKVYESDGLRDSEYARRQAHSGGGEWITHPRAKQCVANIQLGAKMGASVGGIFGLLTGAWMSVSQRNPLLLPVSVIGGAVSFGFFLGCGMIVRCEDRARRTLCDSEHVTAQATRPLPIAVPASWKQTSASCDLWTYRAGLRFRGGAPAGNERPE